MKTLCLVSPPVLYGAGWWANRLANKPHLASLGGAVRDLAVVRTVELDRVAGEDVEVLLGELERVLFESEMAGEVVGLVGISCWTSMHYLGTLAVARRIREILPHVPIVIGGHHPTALPDDFDASVCDFVVTGDGEDVLRRLCTLWPARPPAVQVLSGGVLEGSQGAAGSDRIDWETYGRPGEQGALWLGTSRGCAFKCRFCIEPERAAALTRLDPHAPLYTRNEVQTQLDIIQRLVARVGPRAIAFSDPLFGANRKWLAAFLDGLERLQLPVTFWCETRADLMSPDLLEGFKRCRFVVDFGLDTASETMVRRMAKAAQPANYLDRARATFDEANRIGLHHGIYLVFNFPGETPETVRESMDWIDAIARETTGPLAGWLSCQTFFILPGTQSWLRMSEHAEQYGTTIAHTDWWKQVGDHHALATQVVPHRAWRGREAELRAFQPWNQAINVAWTARYTPEVRAFRQRVVTGVDP